MLQIQTDLQLSVSAAPSPCNTASSSQSGKAGTAVLTTSTSIQSENRCISIKCTHQCIQTKWRLSELKCSIDALTSILFIPSIFLIKVKFSLCQSYCRGVEDLESNTFCVFWPKQSFDNGSLNKDRKQGVGEIGMTGNKVKELILVS